MASLLSEKLLEWYDRSARSLPWRGQTDSYAVWVSEIMCQQTRVDTAIPYYLRWMERFPSVAALAAAEEQDVLQAWEGLGYYSRARNLHRAARQVMEQFNGQLPADRAALEALPGFGHYTAAAVASMAFGLDEAALDGNIRRVLARVFDLRLPARSREGEQRLWQLAREHLPPGRAGDYNQALMDLGAQICTPRSPHCPACPLNALCEAKRLGVQAERPLPEVRPAVPHYTVTAAVLHNDGRVLIARRPSQGLLGGLWEFPGGKLEEGESLPDGLRREIREELAVEIEVGAELGVYQHAYSHFRITLHAFRCTLRQGEPQALAASELRWVAPADLGQFPMGKIDRQIARRVSNLA